MPQLRKPRASKTRASVIEDEIFIGFDPTDRSIEVPDHVGTPTGILDVNGNEIIREPRPIGFGRWT